MPAAVLGAALAPLCAGAPRRPQNARNVTIIRLTPSNITGIVNKDTADAAGDLYYYIGDRMPEPMQCRVQPNSWQCRQRNIVHHDEVYSQHVVEVDSSFGGCATGDADCTKYAECNPVESDPSGATWSCRPSIPDVGLADITQRCSSPRSPMCGGGKHVWDQWKYQTSKFIGGLWYSTQDKGNCDDPSAPSCTWRLVRTVKTVNASCANANVHAAVAARNSTCFGACSPADRADAESDCFINCFFATLFGGMSADDVVKPFEAAFASEDPEKQGCPSLPPV